MASKEQKEGIARVLDTLAASSIIGASLSVSGHTAMSIAHEITLCMLAATFLAFSWILRRPS